ncbi:MAG: FecR domain-containing protein, partial [Candidatus Hydrogenedentes bacterium]|nr:FecR domain-containing protein [Candidatus Hydrogenedentota bacterium]
MYKHTKPLIPVAFIAVISWIGIPATAADVMHARVSFDAGGTLVRGTEDSDWSHATLNSIILPGDTLWVTEGGTTELEMAGGTFLRMADASKVELTALPPDAALRAWTGSIYIQRLSRSTGTLMIETPACKIEVPKDAAVRIDMVEQGSTTVSVHWGQVTVRTDGDAPQTLAERQRVYVDPGLLPSAPMPFDVGSRDDFDIWNSDRAKILATGETRATTPIPATETTLGVSDLNTYGEWVVVENRQYWRPTVVADYIPYRYGHWSFVYGTGYCWVDSYPFAYVTSHYGRWSYFPSYGWCWGYDPVWSPAWVATVRYGPNFCWTPVDFYNRPVVVGAGATFNIGGVAFSFGASTFVPQTQLFYGANYVAPLQPAVIQNIDQTNINIWNININTDRPLVKVPYTDTKLAVFKESPKTILR